MTTSSRSRPAPGRRRRPGRRLAAVVVGVVALLVATRAAPVGAVPVAPSPSPAPPAAAAAGPATTLPPPDRGVPGKIIPEPDSGIPPQSPGDRGGWQQWAVFGVIVAGVATIAVLVTRESLRARRRGGAPARPGGGPPRG